MLNVFQLFLLIYQFSNFYKSNPILGSAKQKDEENPTGKDFSRCSSHLGNSSVKYEFYEFGQT